MQGPTRDPSERLASVKEFGEHGGVNASLELSTTFTVLTANMMPSIFAGQKGPDSGCYLYGRSFNPTVRALSRQLAALEDTEAAYATSSGMAAISSCLMALCNTGDHIVASNTVYGGTFALLKSFLPAKCNVSTTFVDITDLKAVQAAMQPNTKVVYTESVSNPTLVVADLSALAQLAHQRGAQLVVDNTFTPCIITPRHWGADVVVHSMTKFISGASDVIAGCVCGTRQFITSLMDFHTGPLMLLGPTMDPRIAGELMLRLPHLGLRMKEHSRRAQYMAEHLAAVGAPVTYPSLPSHPQHSLTARLANPGYGHGGLLGLDLGSKVAADAFMERLQNKHGFGFMAVSLGFFDTLMSASAASTSSELSAGELEASGIAQGYVRMSVGLTGSLEQRWAQLKEAWTFIAVRGGAQAPYRATKMVNGQEGGTLLSWPSLGSETTLEDLIPSAEPLVSGDPLTTATTITTTTTTTTTTNALLAPAGSEGGTAAGPAALPLPAHVTSEGAREWTPPAGASPLHPTLAGDGTGVKRKVRRLEDGACIVYEPVAPSLAPPQV